MVVALGRGGRQIAEADALTHVYGYAVGLDMTRRDLQGPRYSHQSQLVGIFLAGIGISFIGPVFFGYASARSDKPGGVAVAELGALNQVLTFAGRAVISVVAGAVSLPVAMTIPGVMLILVVFFVAAASQPRKK